MYAHNGLVPVLTGERLQLRAMGVHDADALFQIWRHPEVAPWLGGPVLASVHETASLIDLLCQMAREEESLRWCIVLPGDRVVGSCGYNSWQMEGAFRGEIGCDLLPEFWGRGLMHEALGLVLAYGFQTMGLNRIEALCHPDNKRADKLFQSLGFRWEGSLREYRHTPYGFQDTVIYALLQREWKIT